MSPLVGALLGLLAGIGVLLMIAGWNGWTPRSRFSQAKKAASGKVLQFGIGGAVGLVVMAATSWPVAGLMAGALAIFFPRLFGGAKRERTELARTEAIASWAEMLRDTMAGSAGIEQSIINTASVAPEAIRPEVRSLARRLERESLDSALTAFAADAAHPTADLIVAALRLAARKHAKRLGELLGNLATAARQDATMRLRVDAGRARTQTSVRVVIGATVVMAVGMLVFNGEYLTPYGTPVGQLVLGMVGIAFAGAFYWLDRMRAVESPGRIFAKAVTK